MYGRFIGLRFMLYRAGDSLLLSPKKPLTRIILLIRNIFIPPYLRRGITHNWIGYPHRLTLFGADFETYEGKPYSLQIYDGKDVYFRYVNEKNVLDVFLKYFDRRLLAGQLNVCYFHNLSFDLGVLLYKFHSLYIGRDIIKIKNSDWEISACIS